MLENMTHKGKYDTYETKKKKKGKHHTIDLNNPSSKGGKL